MPLKKSGWNTQMLSRPLHNTRKLTDSIADFRDRVS
jgi:hypothetical protein